MSIYDIVLQIVRLTLKFWDGSICLNNLIYLFVLLTVVTQMISLHALREKLGEGQSRDRVILESVEHFDNIFFQIQYNSSSM